MAVPISGEERLIIRPELFGPCKACLRLSDGFPELCRMHCMSINRATMFRALFFLSSFWTLGVVALRHSISNPLDGESGEYRH